MRAAGGRPGERGGWRAALVLAAALAPACARETPDPRVAARAWADAVARGDADAARALLDERSGARLAPADVRELVSTERDELTTAARAAASASAAPRIAATVAWPDGEHASLSLEDGALRVDAAGALPAGARTPTEALDELRRVLARRSFAGLLRVLAPATRAAIEANLRAIVLGLAHPDGLDVHLAGETASVELAGGHRVRLRRAAGAWHVEDLE